MKSPKVLLKDWYYEMLLQKAKSRLIDSYNSFTLIENNFRVLDSEVRIQDNSTLFAYGGNTLLVNKKYWFIKPYLITFLNASREKTHLPPSVKWPRPVFFLLFSLVSRHGHASKQIRWPIWSAALFRLLFDFFWLVFNFFLSVSLNFKVLIY